MNKIKFARDGKLLAEYPAKAVIGLLDKGVIVSTDYFHEEGMETWLMVRTRWKSPAIEAARLLTLGWTITSDGPIGIMMTGPKKMRGLDQLTMVAGLVAMLWSWVIGLFLLLLVMLDYSLLTKPETKFIPRI